MEQKAQPAHYQEITFLLRLPLKLHSTLRQLAQQERRSLHQQILYILERSIEQVQNQENQE